MHIISRPSVPSAHAIRETLRPGSIIHVRGHVTHCHHKNFSVELLSGPNIVLHVNFRFHHEHKVVMNTSINGHWGMELSHRNPLMAGDKFDLRIHIHDGYYHITVNGEHLADFPHRYPVHVVQAVGLMGSVHVDEITFTGFSFIVDWNTTHDFGHGGYSLYGTDSYMAPVFSAGHPLEKAF